MRVAGRGRGTSGLRARAGERWGGASAAQGWGSSFNNQLREP